LSAVVVRTIIRTVSLTTEQRVRYILAGQYDRAGVEPPEYGPDSYRSALRAVFSHGLSPFTNPEELVKAEEFFIRWMPTPERCGMCIGDKSLVVPWDNDPMTRALNVQHERAHGWARRRWGGDATEADIWFLTAEFIMPSLMRGDETLIDRHPFAPRWLLALLIPSKAA
jgi:hypothetical protein